MLSTRIFWLQASLLCQAGYIGRITMMENTEAGSKEAIMGRKITRVILQIYFLCGSNGGTVIWFEQLLLLPQLIYRFWQRT